MRIKICKVLTGSSWWEYSENFPNSQTCTRPGGLIEMVWRRNANIVRLQSSLAAWCHSALDTLFIECLINEDRGQCLLAGMKQLELTADWVSLPPRALMTGADREERVDPVAGLWVRLTPRPGNFIILDQTTHYLEIFCNLSRTFGNSN